MRFASRFWSLWIMIAIGVSMAGTTAMARRGGSPFIALGIEVGAPRGFVEMCAAADEGFCSSTSAMTYDRIQTASLASSRLPSHLTKTATDIMAVPYGKHEERGGPDQNKVGPSMGEIQHKMLSRINRYVNGRVRQMTDVQIFGRQEVWQRSGVGPRARGDCEDIAIEKRHQLINEGFPPEMLFFAVVYSRASGLHTLLVAHTETGDLVLDNRNGFVRPWHETGYSWISVQSTTDPMIWRQLA